MRIPYGVTGAELRRDVSGAEILESQIGTLKAEGSEDALVQKAMAAPIGSPRLSELARGKKTATIIISDHTRPVPSKHILPFMLDELREGNPDIDITLLIATPIGVGSAIYLNEYAKPGKIVRAIEFTTEILSGIPSIIFGLFGMVFFGTTLGLGYSILTGALTLTLMVLPLITRNTQEALKTVPESYRSGALGMGATKWYMIRTILLPSAMPGILTGVILAIGRIFYTDFGLFFQLPRDSGPLYPATQVIDTYVYRGLMQTSNIGMSSAAGVYQSIVGFILVVSANLVVRKLDSDSALF